jgi:molybdenum cofactor cytidylyltransferase
METLPASLHVLILAAGASSRLGEPKQLVRLGGRPILHTMVTRAVALAGHAVTVVLGAHAQTLTPLLKHSPASIVVNRQWQEGLGSSIRLGVSRLPPACDAVLLVLADQIGVTADDLKRLASAWKGEDTVIAASQYSGTVGVPAIFPRWCFSELMGLRGDHGAKTLLYRHVDRLARVPMTSAALDVDTPAQLAQLRRELEQPSAEIVVDPKGLDGTQVPEAPDPSPSDWSLSS